MKLKKFRIPMKDMKIGDIILDKNGDRVVIVEVNHTFLHNHVKGFVGYYLDLDRTYGCNDTHDLWNVTRDVWRVVE